MKTGIPTKVATHVINYGYIEQLTWEEAEVVVKYHWEYGNVKELRVVSSDDVALEKVDYDNLTSGLKTNTLTLSETTLVSNDRSILRSVPSNWLLPNPDKVSDYDLSDCGDYFIYECDSTHDKSILVNEAMQQDYLLLPSFSTTAVEMARKQTIIFE